MLTYAERQLDQFAEIKARKMEMDEKMALIKEAIANEKLKKKELFVLDIGFLIEKNRVANIHLYELRGQIFSLMQELEKKKLRLLNAFNTASDKRMRENKYNSLIKNTDLSVQFQNLGARVNGLMARQDSLQAEQQELARNVGLTDEVNAIFEKKTKDTVKSSWYLPGVVVDEMIARRSVLESLLAVISSPMSILGETISRHFGKLFPGHLVTHIHPALLLYFQFDYYELAWLGMPFGLYGKLALHRGSSVASLKTALAKDWQKNDDDALRLSGDEYCLAQMEEFVQYLHKEIWRTKEVIRRAYVTQTGADHSALPLDIPRLPFGA
ncbi:unnamed protein product [Schistocephalus solidus]|uniref:Cilia- and flagella-associated protein 157 n=1 Tax=Schistocephalus solidus TaxID=70667 RepID=A0A183TCY6_SCHSO|nr:unnamed protein product [Schistocephalus solidus]